MSFHSVSKGFLGECGKRGGCTFLILIPTAMFNSRSPSIDMEVMNIAPEVKEELYKMVSIGLCPNVTGQIMVSLMVDPPKPGDESYDLYVTVCILSLLVLCCSTFVGWYISIMTYPLI